jgi:hypothetical protein
MVMPTVVLVSTFAMRLATAVFVTRTVGRLELQCRVAYAFRFQQSFQPAFHFFHVGDVIDDDMGCQGIV